MDTPKSSRSTAPNALSYLFGKTWHYSEGNRKSVVAYWLMFLVANAANLIGGPLLMASFINRIQAEGITHENFALLMFILSLTIVLELTFWGFHGPARLIERANAFWVRARYRERLIGGVLSLGLDWHAEHHSGDTIDKVEKGSSALHDFSSESFEVISPIVRLAVCCAMLAWNSPASIAIVLVMISINVWITVRFDAILIPQYRELNQADNKVAESVFDTISNITTVIILRIERLVFGAICARIREPFELYKRNNRVNETKWFLTSLCATIMAALVLALYCWQNLGATHGLLIGNLYVIIRYLGEISSLFSRFTGKYANVISQKAKVLNAEELAEDFRPENLSNHVLPQDWREIRVSDLSFSYSNLKGAPLQLDKLSFSLFRGEKIALVGKSGGGKSTFLKLLRDLYHPRSLTLSVDGVPIPHGFDGINQEISLIPQDPEIFTTTVLDNITLGAEYPLEVVHLYTDMACFTDVIEGLPNNLNSSIKEKGVSLSGGERQRLALSRGLLASRDKSIVLLDEPTSSVDVENEIAIYRNVFEAFVDKTIISSIHRLNLLPLFDRIFFFEEGKMTVGTFEDLLQESPGFRVLWSKQSKSNAR